ncbi:tetrahydromethanopterin S-methyltransferase subunit H [Methanohalophilus sp.]|uniref:tetrahydromethanopterin S-methyltransferase subunit H n=1 Tax=Methanohalophilus sp. TaxID=1966352 RepID=UPI00261B4642|nr:tetrahydromethanopterin S-methyltransferase subunit H [Methanohalophilus sp.]MDK2892002.1 tetrahydromethanopterin S-methyltransferase subunit [Methanohalophilus sp.]
MFRFKNKQEIANIAGVKIGGNPGELATALAGTIFYEGHSIVEDKNEGLFNRVKAEDLINTQASASDETGNPHLVHIFGNTATALTNYVDFVSEITDAPLIIDSPDAAARMQVAGYMEEIGLVDRAVYNSINMSITPKERDFLAESDIDSAIILGFNAVDSSFKGRMDMLENGGGLLDKGLLEIAIECGITNRLIDPGITPMGNGSGISLRISLAVKAKWGLPVGSGIHNAPSSWKWIKEKRKVDPLAYRMCDVGSAVLQQAAGGNFVLYGPIENASLVFPLCAMADIILTESAPFENLTSSPDHPFHKLI